MISTVISISNSSDSRNRVYVVYLVHSIPDLYITFVSESLYRYAYMGNPFSFWNSRVLSKFWNTSHVYPPPHTVAISQSIYVFAYTQCPILIL